MGESLSGTEAEGAALLQKCFDGSVILRRTRRRIWSSDVEPDPSRITAQDDSGFLSWTVRRNPIRAQNHDSRTARVNASRFALGTRDGSNVQPGAIVIGRPRPC